MNRHPERSEGSSPMNRHPERSEGSSPTNRHPERSEGSSPMNRHPERSEGSFLPPWGKDSSAFGLRMTRRTVILSAAASVLS